jgi:ABC-type uncharacterized transport system auxiliary subunit
MRRTSTLFAALALAATMAACGGESNANNANANNANSRSSTDNGNAQGREGIIDTNANVPANANGRTADPGTAVIQNNNSNKNTSGVSTVNDNGNSNRRGNGNNRNN